MNYLSQGSKVAVEGTIQTRSYDDNNGQKRYITEVIANSVEFLESKKESTEITNKSITTNLEKDTQSNPFEEFGQQIFIDPDELPFD